MAQDKLFFNRDTRVFVRLGDYVWEVPVLDGFSFSQATNATEVTLNEMDNATTGSRRARQMFNDSYAPAEWSFSTYARPRFASSHDRSCEEVLWALLAGPAAWDDTNKDFEDASGNIYLGQGDIGGSAANYQEINFSKSNTSTLGTADIYFVLGANNVVNAQTEAQAGNLLAYKIEGCVVNEMSFDFDVEGLATLNWSGFGTIIKEVGIDALSSAPSSSEIGDVWVTPSTDGNSNAPVVKIAKTANHATVYTSETTEAELIDEDTFVRNKLSFLTMVDSTDSVTYSVVATGGNITVNNNITFVTPETLGVVNQPLGHVTGTRTVSGNVTCYLGAHNTAATRSADLFEDLIEDTSNITQNFAITLNVGGEPGQSSQGPCLSFIMPKCHVEIPTHSFEDVISLETNFHALPTNVDSADELEVRYAG